MRRILLIGLLAGFVCTGSARAQLDSGTGEVASHAVNTPPAASKPHKPHPAKHHAKPAKPPRS